jgi:flagellar protein FliO/FliZ
MKLSSSSTMRSSPLVIPVGTSLLLPMLAGAETTTSPDLGSSILQLGLGSALVLGLLFATLWLLKKIGAPRGASANLIRVISAAAVGPRERVVVVAVGDKHLVLGVAPGLVSLLSETAQPLADIQLNNTVSAAPVVPDFAQWLKRTLAKRNEK